MKRLLEIEGDVEKVLAQICDAALKAGGMAIHGVVNQLINSIQHVPDPSAAPAVEATKEEQVS